MILITSRNFSLPETPDDLTNRVWFNMWSKKLWPYNELEAGDTLLWYETPSQRIVWQSKVVHVIRFPYELKEDVENKLNLSEADVGQPYFVDAPESGVCLSYKVEAIERVSFVKPVDFRFPQIGWIRVSDHPSQEWPDLATKLLPLGSETIYQLVNTPLVSQYVSALTALGGRVTDAHRRIFQAHYQAPDRIATATQLANWASIDGGTIVVNSLYGKLGHAICDELEIKPELRPDATYRWWSMWSRGWDGPKGFIWQMLPEVANALEELGWVDQSSSFVMPEEIVSQQPMIEGAVRVISVNAYERNSEARRKCIETLGANCVICGFCFGTKYGDIADGYIHVHHLRPLAEIKGPYAVDPIKDLRPVCPNCHAVLHLRTPAYSIDEVRELLETEQNDATK